MDVIYLRPHRLQTTKFDSDEDADWVASLLRSPFCDFSFSVKLIRGLYGGLHGGVFRGLFKSTHSTAANMLVDAPFRASARPGIIYPRNAGT